MLRLFEQITAMRKTFLRSQNITEWLSQFLAHRQFNCCGRQLKHRKIAYKLKFFQLKFMFALIMAIRLNHVDLGRPMLGIEIIQKFHLIELVFFYFHIVIWTKVYTRN